MIWYSHTLTRQLSQPVCTINQGLQLLLLHIPQGVSHGDLKREDKFQVEARQKDIEHSGICLGKDPSYQDIDSYATVNTISMKDIAGASYSNEEQIVQERAEERRRRLVAIISAGLLGVVNSAWHGIGKFNTNPIN